MIRISQLKLSVFHDERELTDKIRKTLKLSKNEAFSYEIKKRSIDARKKPDLYYVYSLNVKVKEEDKILKRVHSNSVISIEEKEYEIPNCGEKPMNYKPVIIGAGPAGLFCSYLLALQGYKPIVIERGKRVEERQLDVEEFWKTGILNPSSNVQFGEGGAGTFSDGKLNTAVKDPKQRIQFVLQTFVKFGAPKQILFDNKPHIGTDILAKVIVNMRRFLEENGTMFFFNTCMIDFEIENGCISKVICIDEEGKKKSIATNHVILAIGHSARDTIKMLYEKQLSMEPKSFAVGFRVEHPQEQINTAMYGENYDTRLPASPYKVTSNFPNGRGVYSFCMCPGGYVVNSSSKENCLVVNGMSYSRRDSRNANSAIIVSVTPEDFDGKDALCGMRFQEELEQKNYQIGNGKIPQQLYADYKKNQITTSYGTFSSCVKGDIVFANLRGLLTEEMEECFIQGMEHFSKIIPEFNRDDAIMSGMETRTSSPIRIHRNEIFEGSIKGIYPCGEGAGFAGGITSAAMDGLKVAEAIISNFSPVKE